MEIHTSTECQKYWRDIFADQIENVLRSYWPHENDADLDRNAWFREGLRYALMIIRHDVYEDN